MYLSQLILNPQTRTVLNDLADPYQLHCTVMSAFPHELPAGERVLFRLEMQRREPYLSILVQSHSRPNWELLHQRGYLLRPAAIKTFDFQPAPAQILRFRLLANPTKRLRIPDREEGPRVGLVREEDQFAWLTRKGELHGFRILSAQIAKVDQPDGWKSQEGKNHRIRQQAVRFDGVLQVTDAGLLATALANGIGSAKGFGFGLLSLAPAG